MLSHFSLFVKKFDIFVINDGYFRLKVLKRCLNSLVFAEIISLTPSSQKYHFKLWGVLIKTLFSTLILIIFLLILQSAYCLANETLLIGINVPLTGAYSQQGIDQLRAYKLAVNIINGRGGVLGRKIIYSVRDTKTNGEVARKNAADLILSGAEMITGGSSSASAVAQGEVCQENGIVFMAGLTHSNATTGSKGHRHTFRWYNNAHQTAQTMASVLVQRFGKGTKYGFIYADYTWGHTVQESLQRVIEKNGGVVVYNKPTKLGTKSYISKLLEAERAAPDVLVMVQFGKDMVTSLKQVTLLKLRDKFSIIVPLMELNMAMQLGADVMQGIITSFPWYHSLAERYVGSRYFVELFEARYGRKPGNAAAVAWVNVFQYADAVKRGGSFDSKSVIQQLENHHFTLLVEEEYWRDWDHQGIHPTFIAVGKTPDESENEYDLFKIIAEKKGEDVARTRSENPVVLEPLEP